MKKSSIFAIIATLSMLIILMTFIVFVEISVRYDTLDELVIESPDLSTIPDGTYEGSYDIFPLSIKVEVTIIDHQYNDISVISESLFFDKEAELIIVDIIDFQTLNVEISEDYKYSEKILLLAIFDSINSINETVFYANTHVFI